MANVSCLIKQGKLEEAARIVLNAFRNLLNRKTQGLDLSPEEFYEIAPQVLEYMQDPTKIKPNIPEEGLGSKVYTEASKSKVTISFVGPAGVDLPDDIEKILSVGGDYNFKIPEIPGYTAQINVVKGKAGNTDSIITVEYVKTPKVPVEPLYGSIAIYYDNPEDDHVRGYTDNGGNDPSTVQAFMAGDFYWHKMSEVNTSDAENTTEGNFVGFTLTAPEKFTSKEEVQKVKMRKVNDDGTIDDIDLTKALFAEEMEDGVEFTVFTEMTPELMKNPTSVDGYPKYTYQVDWNADGLYEQTVIIQFVTDSIYLYNKRKKPLWPEDEE